MGVSRRGVRVIDTFDGALDLADGEPHIVEWNRWPDGTMTVGVDGGEVMRVRDEGFRDAFEGFTLVSAGGDYALRSIAIMGTP